MHDEGTRLTRNAATAYAERGLLVVSALVLTPYLFRQLGPAGFGTWSVMFTLATIFGLLEAGFSDGIVRLVAARRGDGRRAELQRTVSVGVASMAALGVVALAAGVAAALLLSGLAPPAERDGFRTGMLLLAAAMLVRFPCVAYGATLRGYQRYDLSNAALMATTAAFAVGAVVAVESGAGILGVAAAHAVALTGGGLLYAVLLVRLDRSLSLAPGLGDGSARRAVFGFSSFTLLAESFNFVGQRMDVVIIAALRNAAAAGPYAAALKLQSGVQSLTLPFVAMLLPMASELWARGERTELFRRLTIATRVAVQLTLPVALGLSLFAADVVRLWLGPQAPPVTATIVVLLMAVQVLGLSAAPSRRVLVAVGRVRVIAGLSLIEGGANVALTVVLVGAYGAAGAAAATLVTVAAIAPLKFPLVARALGFSVLRLLRDGVGAAAASSAPGAAAMLAVWLVLPPGPSRLALGLGLGLGISLLIGVRQVGAGRIRAVLGARRGALGDSTGPEDSELGSGVPAEGSSSVIR